MIISNTVRALGDILFPQFCVLCGISLGFETGTNWYPVCRKCTDNIMPIDGEICLKCGIPLISENTICTRCRSQSYSFTRNLSVFLYREEVKELVHQYKFEGRFSIGYLFAPFLAGIYKKYYSNIPVVPVPQRPKAKIKRGWDPVGFLGSILSKHYGIEVTPLLKRGNAAQQKTLSFEERLQNLKGKFSYNSKKYAVRGSIDSVVLFDDVFTTGATASECSKVLRSNGIREVLVLTLVLD